MRNGIWRWLENRGSFMLKPNWSPVANETQPVTVANTVLPIKRSVCRWASHAQMSGCVNAVSLEQHKERKSCYCRSSSTVYTGTTVFCVFDRGLFIFILLYVDSLSVKMCQTGLLCIIELVAKQLIVFVTIPACTVLLFVLDVFY